MQKKIAIFHNYLDNIGGAEMVGLTLARELNADVYTTNIDKEKIIRMGFKDVLPRIFSIGKVPINAPFKQQFSLWRFRYLNLRNKYDFYIIDGDWAMAGAVNNKPNLWYVHSPMREIWDLYGYLRKNVVPTPLLPFFDAWVFYNRFLNKKYAKKVDLFACNSNNTKERLRKFLDKDAAVIYPPVETKNFYYLKNGNFWLSVNRLLPPKRIELQIKAFAKMPEKKLIIVGSYEKSKNFLKHAAYIKSIKPKNVEIVSWISNEELLDLYANCKAFIATSLDEDFGMTAVEAMASGKPAIAPNEGGYKESITSETGMLINDIDENKIIDAVEKIENEIKNNPEKLRNSCQKRAGLFDTQIFIKKIKAVVENEG